MAKAKPIDSNAFPLDSRKIRTYRLALRRAFLKIPQWIWGALLGVGLAAGGVWAMKQQGVFGRWSESRRLSTDLKGGPLGGLAPERITNIRFLKIAPSLEKKMQDLRDPAEVKAIVQALAQAKPAGIANHVSTHHVMVLIEFNGKTKSLRIGEKLIRANVASSAAAAQWETPKELLKYLQ